MCSHTPTHSQRRPDSVHSGGWSNFPLLGPGDVRFLIFLLQEASVGVLTKPHFNKMVSPTPLCPNQAQGWERCNGENYSSSRSSWVSFLEEGHLQHGTHKAGKSGKRHLRSLVVTCGHDLWLPPDERQSFPGKFTGSISQTELSIWFPEATVPQLGMQDFPLAACLCLWQAKSRG